MLSLNRRTLLLGAAASLVQPAGSALADAPILTVSGKIAGGGERSLTLAELEAQPRASFSTKTPWNAVPSTFEGIGIDVFLNFVGATGTTLTMVALNDYLVEAAIADFKGLGGIFAYRENGHEMPVSDKGPLFVVFPFDDNAALRQQSIYARCIWQLATIEVS